MSHMDRDEELFADIHALVADYDDLSTTEVVVVLNRVIEHLVGELEEAAE